MGGYNQRFSVGREQTLTCICLNFTYKTRPAQYIDYNSVIYTHVIRHYYFSEHVRNLTDKPIIVGTSARSSQRTKPAKVAKTGCSLPELTGSSKREEEQEAEESEDERDTDEEFVPTEQLNELCLKFRWSTTNEKAMQGAHLPIPKVSLLSNGIIHIHQKKKITMKALQLSQLSFLLSTCSFSALKKSCFEFFCCCSLIYRKSDMLCEIKPIATE